MSTFQPRAIKAGEWTVTALTDGTMGLDGGSMWGVVPAVLWRKMTPPDAENRISLALRPFLAERGDVKVVIEGGIGGRWEEKWRSIYAIERNPNLVESLAECGVAPEEVTHVVATHCHFDHIGALVEESPDQSGVLVPTFPSARHFAPAIEVAIAKKPGHVRAASYRAEDIVPIEEAGLLETYTGEAEPLPGIRVHPAEGHSDGVCVVTVNEDGDGDTAIFWADVVPTGHHIQPSYIMAYDIDVVRSHESRSRWLAAAAEKGWIGLFYHDLDRAFGRIHDEGKPGKPRYRFEEIEGEAL